MMHMRIRILNTNRARGPHRCRATDRGVVVRTDHASPAGTLMVRVLLIRHGTTDANLRDARMAISVAKGEVTRAEAPAAMRAQLAAAAPDEQTGDTHRGRPLAP